MQAETKQKKTQITLVFVTGLFLSLSFEQTVHTPHYLPFKLPLLHGSVHTTTSTNTSMEQQPQEPTSQLTKKNNQPQI